MDFDANVLAKFPNVLIAVVPELLLVSYCLEHDKLSNYSKKSSIRKRAETVTSC